MLIYNFEEANTGNTYLQVRDQNKCAARLPLNLVYTYSIWMIEQVKSVC